VLLTTGDRVDNTPMPSSVFSAASHSSQRSQQNGFGDPRERGWEDGQTVDTTRYSSRASSASSTPVSTARYSTARTMPIAAETNGVHAEETLPALQAQNAHEGDRLDPVADDDPRSFDLVNPADETRPEEYSLEKSSKTLFSKEHLQVIFNDPRLLLQFTTFLGAHAPASVPILVHYLDSLKSLRALHYANAICEGLDPVAGLDFTSTTIPKTVNEALEARANAAFDILVREELPAFITHQYIQIVSASITARITGSLSPHLREASEGLAEVFCLTDPSRKENPIVFASEGIHAMDSNVLVLTPIRI
jgi:hypothetical protein